MVLKNDRGVAMAAVVMVMLVLFLVGSAFVGVASYQNTQAAKHDKGMRAHYLARAGAEATLTAWMDAPNGGKITGVLDTVYINETGNFSNSTLDQKGSFDISISPDAVNPGKTRITSVGRVMEVEKTVTVTIDTIQSVIPAPSPDYVSGNGFYDFNSGQIGAVKGSDFRWPALGVETKGIVKNEAKKGKGLKIPNKNTGSATQVYEKMLFASTLQVLHNKVILESNVIVFMKEIDFSANSNNEGALILKVYPSAHGGGGLSVPGLSGNWGVLIIEDAGYYFKDIPGGIVLRQSGDIGNYVSSGQLVKINDPSELSPFLSDVLGEPLTVTSYTILWGD